MLRSGALRFLRVGSGRRAGQERRLWRTSAASLAGAAARAFPEREILLRSNDRVHFLRLSRNFQLSILGALTLLGGWLSYTAATQLFFEQIVVAKDDEIGRITRAYRLLQSETANANVRYGLITQQLEAKHAYLLSLLEQNSSLRESLGQMQGRLDSSEAERTRILASRDGLHTQLRQLEGSLRETAAEKDVLLGSLNRKDGELQQALAERSRMLQERRRLQARAGELEHRLSNLQAAQQRALDRIAARTVGSIEEAREIIAMTGLDADQLLAQIGTGGGLGGPFVAAPLDRTKSDKNKASAGRDRKAPATASKPGAVEGSDTALAALNSQMDRWDDLQLVLRRLPFATPTDNYAVVSTYGRRRDPFNRQWAVHYGVDLSAPAKSPIYSTGPGTVVFAGKNGSYGMMVEIDHGMGIVTRYGHLHSAQVRKGQTVNLRQQIGLMGSSGRSTGVHVHYEVLVNGKPLDPMKFIQAGRHVFKG